MGNKIEKRRVHTSSYWQEVARTMEYVNTGTHPDTAKGESLLSPSGQPSGKPNRLNHPGEANP